jgi:hypothetical protein
MPRENVEVIKRYYAELPSTRERLAGAVARFWEADGDYYPVRKFPEAKPCHGREEIVDFLSEYRAAWERYEYMVKDARAVGDDRVLVHGHLQAEGRLSGLAMEGDLYHCCWLRHGRLIRVEDHLTAKGALHALGLSGEALEAVGLRE